MSARTVVLPREVALHLRAGRAHRITEPRPPAIAPPGARSAGCGRGRGRPGLHRARHHRGTAQGLERGRPHRTAFRRPERPRPEAHRGGARTCRADTPPSGSNSPTQQGCWRRTAGTSRSVKAAGRTSGTRPPLPTTTGWNPPPPTAGRAWPPPGSPPPGSPVWSAAATRRAARCLRSAPAWTARPPPRCAAGCWPCWPLSRRAPRRSRSPCWPGCAGSARCAAPPRAAAQRRARRPIRAARYSHGATAVGDLRPGSPSGRWTRRSCWASPAAAPCRARQGPAGRPCREKAAGPAPSAAEFTAARSRAAAAAGAALPEPLDHVLLQADLTAVAPGPLERAARRAARRARRHRVQGRRDRLPLHARLRPPRPRRRADRRRPARLPRRALPYAGAAAADLPRSTTSPAGTASCGSAPPPPTCAATTTPLLSEILADRRVRRPCGCAGSPRPCWPPRPTRRRCWTGCARWATRRPPSPPRAMS